MVMLLLVLIPLLVVHQFRGYLVVVMVAAHSNRVHDKLPPLVVTGSTVGDVVGVVLCSKVMAQLVSGHQVGLLMRHKQTRVICLKHIVYYCINQEENRTKTQLYHAENAGLTLRLVVHKHLFH